MASSHVNEPNPETSSWTCPKFIFLVIIFIFIINHHSHHPRKLLSFLNCLLHHSEIDSEYISHLDLTFINWVSSLLVHTWNLLYFTSLSLSHPHIANWPKPGFYFIKPNGISNNWVSTFNFLLFPLTTHPTRQWSELKDTLSCFLVWEYHKI